MTEVWLQANKRAVLLGLIVPDGVALLGMTMLTGWVGNGNLLWKIAGGLFAIAGGLMMALLAWQYRQPRLALQDDHLLVFLRFGTPIRLPVALGECFLLGSGPSFLPGKTDKQQTRNIVLRVAESAPEWARQTVHPALGAWCEGYITFRGAWCEPLDLGVVQRLNKRLAELKGQPTSHPNTCPNS